MRSQFNCKDQFHEDKVSISHCLGAFYKFQMDFEKLRIQGFQ
jgi:hypothetical protein